MGSAGEMGAPRLRGSSSRVNRQRGAVRENRRSDQIPEPACWFIHFLKMFFYLFILRERAEEGQREREGVRTQAGSTLSVQSLMWGLNSQTVRS